MDDFPGEDDATLEEPVNEDVLDLDSLRASSARAGSMFDEEMEDMEFEQLPMESSSGLSLSAFTPGQRLVLALLLVFDVIAVGVGLLLVMGVF
jgi:hypothetical protein